MADSCWTRHNRKGILLYFLPLRRKTIHESDHHHSTDINSSVLYFMDQNEVESLPFKVKETAGRRRWRRVIRIRRGRGRSLRRRTSTSPLRHHLKNYLLCNLHFSRILQGDGLFEESWKENQKNILRWYDVSFWIQAYIHGGSFLRWSNLQLLQKHRSWILGPTTILVRFPVYPHLRLSFHYGQLRRHRMVRDPSLRLLCGNFSPD